MDIYQLKCVFMWCSIINVGLLLFVFLFLSGAGGWIHRLHSRFFPMTKEQWNATIYLMMGIYKTLVFVFFVIPWIALEIAC